MLIEVKVERKDTGIILEPLALNQKIGEYMVSSTQRKIRTGVQPANAALTTAVKQNAKTLRDRGQLMASITCRADASKATVGTNHIGAKVNQFGMTIRA
jgi:phage gpG-like protein